MHLRTSTLWPASARFGPVLLPGRPVVDMPSALGWWLSVPSEQVDDWMPLVDGAAGECCLNQPLPTWAEPSDDGAAGEVTDVPSALQQLALLALHQEER